VGEDPFRPIARRLRAPRAAGVAGPVFSGLFIASALVFPVWVAALSVIVLIRGAIADEGEPAEPTVPAAVGSIESGRC
jgi:hypothetical protein